MTTFIEPIFKRSPRFTLWLFHFSIGLIFIVVPLFTWAGKTEINPNENLDAKEIHYSLKENNSKEVIVFLHGLNSSMSSFTTISKSFETEFTVLLFDQKGHGGTPKKGTDYSPRTLALDLLTLLDYLKIQQVHLVGSSFGAKTAVAFASLAPERTLSITLEDMDMDRRIHNDPIKFLKAADEIARFAQPQFSSEELTDFLARFFDAAMEDFRDKIREVTPGKFELTYHPDVAILYSFGARSSNLTEEYEDLTIPILVLQADPTKTAISEFGKRSLKRAEGRLSYQVILNAEHNIHKSAPDEFVKELTQFLSSLSN